MSNPPALPAIEKPKLLWYQMIWIGWPFALVAVGGALGRACGGAAWAINQQVFQATKNPALRYVWTGLISLAAIVVYLVVAALFLSLTKSH